jgi:hypothetical protein
VNKLGQLRADLAAIATAGLPASVAVFDHLPDSVPVPAVLIGWSDPWLTPDTLCTWTAAAELLCVTGRMDVAGQLVTLEEIIIGLVDALEPSPFEIAGVTAPFAIQIAGVNYLAATITVHRST